MPSTEKLTIEVDAKVNNATRQIDNLDKKMGDLGKSTKTTDSNLDDLNETTTSSIGEIASLAAGVVAATAALAGMVTVITDAIDQTDKMVVGQKRLEAILKSTGEQSGKTAAQLREEADALALNTLTSVEEVQKAQAQLLTFTNVADEQFTRTIALSQDLAELGFGSISSAAVQLGKALQDPETGLTALTRVGVSFTDQQKAQIKAMQDAGRQAEAQTLILNTLTAQVGGAGEASADGTLIGASDTLGQKWDELKESFADRSGVYQIAIKGVNGIADAVDKLNKLISPTPAEDIEALTKVLTQAQNQLIELSKTEQIDFFNIESASERAQELFAIAESAQNKINALQQKQADEEKKRAEAKAAAEKAAADKRLEVEAQKDQELLDMASQFDDEIAAKRQANLDRVVEDLKSQEELLADSMDRQLEIVEEANISEQEKADLRLAIWEAYFSDLADLQSKSQKNNEKNDKKDIGSMNNVVRAGSAANKLLFDDNKAVSSALALVNVATGVTKALSTQNWAAAAATALEGAVQIAAINSASIGSSGSTAVPSATAPAPDTPESTELITQTSDVSGRNELVITINGDDSEMASAITGILKQAEITGELT